MSKELLYGFRGQAIFKRPGCKGMPQGMRSNTVMNHRKGPFGTGNYLFILIHFSCDSFQPFNNIAFLDRGAPFGCKNKIVHSGKGIPQVFLVTAE